MKRLTHNPIKLRAAHTQIVSGLSLSAFIGTRPCPPEDCGGLPGYYEFLRSIASKETKKRNAALEWYGGPYDPDQIDEQKIITALRGQQYQR